MHRLDLSNQSQTAFAAHDSWVRAIGVSADGKLMCSGGYDGRLAIWPADAADPKPLAVVDAHQGWIRALGFSPDGQQIATCGNDGLIKLWKSQDLTLVRTFTGHASHVYNVGFTKDGQQLRFMRLTRHCQTMAAGSKFG